MLVGVLLLVAIFRTSEALASAYGIAVTTTMVVDGILGFIVIWKAWGWRPLAAGALMVPLVLIDSDLPICQPAQDRRWRLGAARAGGRNCVARTDVAARDHLALAQDPPE